MQEILDTTNQDKKEQLFKNGLEEFGRHGYHRASLNNIIAHAQVSKGLFYHYYKNKLDFFDSIGIQAFEIIRNKIYAQVDWTITDVIARIVYILKIREQYLMRYPFLFEFVYNHTFSELQAHEAEDAHHTHRASTEQTSSVQTNSKIKNKIAREMERLKNEVFSRDVDLTLFRDGIDVEKSMRIIEWTIESLHRKKIDERRRQVVQNVKISQQQSNEFFESFSLELEEYAQVLRRAFYK